MSRDGLLKQLQGLLPAELEEVLYRLNITPALLSGGAQTVRAIEALRYLEHRDQLDRLTSILGELHGEERSGEEEAAAGGASAAGRPLHPVPRGSTSPLPAYLDSVTRALSERIENARARKTTLREAGIATDEVDREIIDLRRELREGGQLRPGDSLGEGRYLLIKQLGRGGFAIVWEAHDRQEQRRVAIKVLHAHLAADPQRRERFFRGARVMKQLTHPAIVRVHDPQGEDETFCYFVMELVSGGNLREAVLAGGVAVERLVPLVLQIGEALAEAHKQKLVHRDVKPANILLDERGDAKLTDFDLVGAHDTTGGTRTGALGTVVYAAPECLDKPHEATARADVFGLGMTAIFCLSGRDLLMATFRNPEATVARLDCAEAVRAVFVRAVAWEPESRFADAGQMVDMLRWALEISKRVAEAAEVMELAEVVHVVPSSEDVTVPIAAVREVENDERTPREKPALEAWMKDQQTPRLAVGSNKPRPVQDVTTDALALYPASVGREANAKPNNSASSVTGQRPRWRSWLAVVPAALALLLVGAIVQRKLASSPVQRVNSPDDAHAPAKSGSAAPAGVLAVVRAAGSSGSANGCPDDMVLVSAGTFRMGNPAGTGDADEHPSHQVTLSSYCIDRTEVTVAVYARCVTAGKCLAATTPYDACNGNRADRQSHPVNCVDWEQANAYCMWSAKRLPTEAEWEYAARGNEGRTYPWGNDVPTETRLNWRGRGTVPVGSYPSGKSLFGAEDMAGNVWEWVADWYGPYSAAASTNPTGPKEGEARVVRGGGWSDDDAAYVRGALRNRRGPSFRVSHVGFRCARGD